MTEEEWLASGDARAMLFALEQLKSREPRPSPDSPRSTRKLRLFTIANARLVYSRFGLVFLREAVEAAERYADGEADDEELRRRREPLWHFFMTPSPLGVEERNWYANTPDAHAIAAHCFCATLLEIERLVTTNGFPLTSRLTGSHQPFHLREIFGNPFQPVAFDPSWRTSTAVAVAKGMYDSRDFAAMPLLADALEDAGCADERILDHCRGPGPHVKGCWVVDLVLGKE